MNQKQKCIILSLCLRIMSPRKPWEFYLSYTTVEGEGDKGGEVDKQSHKVGRENQGEDSLYWRWEYGGGNVIGCFG